MKKIYSIIVGATSDIGKLLIEKFFNTDECRLIIQGRNRESLNKYENTNYSKFECDLSIREEIILFIERVLNVINSENIQIKYFIYCPGTCGSMDPVSFLQMKNDFMKVYNVNLLAPILIFESLKDYLCDDSSSVFISSINSVMPMECGSAYCSTKSGLSEYVKQTSKCIKSRINSIAPGMLFTKFHDPYFNSRVELDEFFEKHKKNTLFNRVVELNNVIRTMEYLLGSESIHVTGVEIVIDCGEILTNRQFTSDDDDCSENT